MLGSLRNDELKRTASATTPPPGQNEEADNSRRFGKARRLTDAASFSRVFRRADRSKDKLFIVLSRPNGRGYARLGLAIAKKQCRFAHARNRLKRIVRESFRNNQHALTGIDAVVMCTAAAAGETNRTLFASLDRHWRHASRRAAAGR